jgi:antagonist of KipI
MVSSGVQPGTVQVTHDGQAIILLADAQTIGGYPRVLQCASRSIDDLAQLRVGDQLSLTLLDYPTVSLEKVLSGGPGSVAAWNNIDR